jgi:N-acetylneuraminate synthase
MSSWEEQDRIVAFVKNLNVGLALFQCTTAYPTKPHEVGLNVMAEMRTRYGVPVGLSDHSGHIYPSLAAASLKADLIEVHVTLSRQMFGPDVVASLTPAELADLVTGVRFIEGMLNSPVNKDEIALQRSELRDLFFHSLVARTDLDAGTILGREHLATKKPGTGIPAERLNDLVGRQLARKVKRDQLLSEEDFVK